MKGYDVLLQTLLEMSDELLEPSNTRLTLLIGGATVVGMTAPHTAVTRDIWRGLDVDDEEKLKDIVAGDLVYQSKHDFLSLIDVTIFQGQQRVILPYLRVRLSAIDAWFAGAQAQIQLIELRAGNDPG